MKMNILVTVDSNYLHPLTVMLKSLFMNNPNEQFSIYLVQSSIPDQQLELLDAFISGEGHEFHNIPIDDQLFSDAPTLMHYTKTMYYRLLAHKFLPQHLDRILYLDPDILVINRIRELYELDLEGYLFAAADHRTMPIKEINKIRFNPFDLEAYYNSGVLLMNLPLLRETIDEKEIFDFVEKYHSKLIMPDQDIMNALYSKKIKGIDEVKYNYDARYYNIYKLKSSGLFDMDYVMNHTVILHFCGKKKPWKKNYSGKFHSLYKHYEKITNDAVAALEGAKMGAASEKAN
ncbi:glycosyltransferase family 8 protein [Ureibacillus sp. FSL K6-8385]|uniref:Glycosyltransferase family 8 protein n=1 Tax=Ureibacillus terrenus TaxID=118246 RepID=A0A540V5Q3_9BACL|nr:glycosyltransferase family 8 protein [Ureibacillus terrenus]MED3661260.1 glycosyltransferase family 8 protein [Ureibacillus terrenus]MED3764265.1 glycosyltransferase family 8 protein [Ureibacillus terrenus]TQE92048.1 glycosyltransferase family 8 protein [Ureibacillus terrenus]